MQRMSHLGWHTFPGEDRDHAGHAWLTHFSRAERHRLVEEDRSARWGVIGLIVSLITINFLVVAGVIVFYL